MALKSKGAIVGAIVGIFLWSSYLWLMPFVSREVYLPIFKGFVPFCGLVGSGSFEAVGMCWLFFGHITNIIIFAVAGFAIDRLRNQIRKN